MRGKRVRFDDETWCAFNQPAKDRMHDFRELANNDEGSTSIEYGLIAAGIAIGLTMALSSVGSQVKSAISDLTDMASSSSKDGGAAPTQPSASSQPVKR
jgi:Flp pilus assembly pilin Flp